MALPADARRGPRNSESEFVRELRSWVSHFCEIFYELFLVIGVTEALANIPPDKWQEFHFCRVDDGCDCPPCGS